MSENNPGPAATEVKAPVEPSEPKTSILENPAPTFSEGPSNTPKPPADKAPVLIAEAQKSETKSEVKAPAVVLVEPAPKSAAAEIADLKASVIPEKIPIVIKTPENPLKGPKDVKAAVLDPSIALKDIKTEPDTAFIKIVDTTSGETHKAPGQIAAPKSVSDGNVLIGAITGGALGKADPAGAGVRPVSHEVQDANTSGLFADLPLSVGIPGRAPAIGQKSRLSSNFGAWNLSVVKGERHFAVIDDKGNYVRQLGEHDGNFYDIDAAGVVQGVTPIPANWIEFVASWSQHYGKLEWAF